MSEETPTAGQRVQKHFIEWLFNLWKDGGLKQAAVAKKMGWYRPGGVLLDLNGEWAGIAPPVPNNVKVSLVLTGKRRIDLATAIDLASALGAEPEDIQDQIGESL